jgi:hypothetical protein
MIWAWLHKELFFFWAKNSQKIIMSIVKTISQWFHLHLQSTFCFFRIIWIKLIKFPQILFKTWHFYTISLRDWEKSSWCGIPQILKQHNPTAILEPGNLIAISPSLWKYGDTIAVFPDNVMALDWLKTVLLLSKEFNKEWIKTKSGL